MYIIRIKLCLIVPKIIQLNSFINSRQHDNRILLSIQAHKINKTQCLSGVPVQSLSGSPQELWPWSLQCSQSCAGAQPAEESID